MDSVAAHHALGQLMADTRRIARDMKILIDHANSNGLSPSIVLGWVTVMHREWEQRLVDDVMASDDDEEIFDLALDPECN